MKPGATALRRTLAALLAVGSLAAPALAEPRHGLSIFGDLKYPADFRHFEYVNPDAPKGGEFRSWGVESFDTLNPFILKGVAPVTISESFGIERTFATLLAPAADEPDSAYGLAAEWAERAADGRHVTFRLRAGVTFHDGTPIQADDVVFSFETLKKEGHPRYRLLLSEVERASAVDPRTVRFDFSPRGTRDLPLVVGALPILSRASFASRSFTETTLTPLLGSGPYRVDKVDPGRSITYRRLADWWGRDLPVARGRFNFETIRYDFFRDRDIALEAFFAGEYDWREEFTARSWATAYDNRPAVKDGRIKRLTLPDGSLSGFQAYFLNMRRDKFRDVRVREAFALAFDFEWSNRTLFHSLYKRNVSIFPNSDYAAVGRPAGDELALLEPLRDKLPAETFGEPYRPPVSDGSGTNRENLRKAQQLLGQAGWRIRDGKLVDGKGQPFQVEFLMFERSFERVNAPFVQNLGKLGIEATMRLVDPAQFQNRERDYDFDIVVRRYGMPQTPGVEQFNYWHSRNREVPGTFNLAGIGDPAVDRLVEAMVDAKTRPALVAAARALDRTIMWNRYTLPQWHKGEHNIAYWDKFGRPMTKPKYGLAVVDTWWVDPALDAKLRR